MTGSLSGALKGAVFGAISAGAAYGIGHGGGVFKSIRDTGGAFGKALAHGVSRSLIAKAKVEDGVQVSGLGLHLIIFLREQV